MEQNNEIPEQKVDMSWIDKEIAEQQSNKPIDRKPAIKLEENKIYEMDIDFSKPWDKWTNPDDGTIKKIIPVKYGGVDSVFFLNVRNPLHRQLLELGRKGQTKFKVIRLGQAKATKYSLVN